MRCWRPQPRPLNSWLKSLRERWRACKSLMTRGQHSEVERALREEVMVISERLESPETKSAARSAFLEKRKARFFALPIVPVRNETIRKPLIMGVFSSKGNAGVRIPRLTQALGQGLPMSYRLRGWGST